MGVKVAKKSFKAIVTQVENLTRCHESESIIYGRFKVPGLKQIGLCLESVGPCPDAAWELGGKRVRITILD